MYFSYKRVESAAKLFLLLGRKWEALDFYWKKIPMRRVRLCSFPSATSASSEEWKPLDYSQNFFFPCFHLKMCFLTTEEEKNVQKLCFYFWAPTQGTFVQSGWPQGGAHGTACSVSSLPLNLPEFQRRRKFNSKHSASSHPPQAVSAGIWHRNEWNRTTSGKVTQTRGQVG